jgi:hypothetical protein
LRPKNLGGLGIKDLEKFNMTLRLRWLWHNWDQQEKPWKNMLKIDEPEIRWLFFCSTSVLVSDGKSTPFWEARWLNGAAPKDLAPNLFRSSRYKRRSVYKELQGLNCIRNLGDITTEDMLEEFTMLFMALNLVTLNDRKDEIKWRWMIDGRYTVKSAYECQFLGAMVFFPAKNIWRAIAEPKCKFFLLG